MKSNEKQDIDFSEPILEPIQKTMKPTIAGIILIVIAVFTIVVSVTLVTIDEYTIERIIEMSPQIQELMANANLTERDLMNIYSTCGTIGIVMSIFIILSGILALKRRLWGIALVGAIVGIATFLITIFSGVIAFIPLILLIISRKEFT
jgi:hypothetical protein